MFNSIGYKKISLLKQQPEDIKIILLYRCLSLIITSIFYIVGSPDHSIERKIFIVACIALSSIILQYLYIKNWHSTSNIVLLVLIETLGNTILLIPSGGISSPYLWYSLNTILTTSLKLNRILCWFNLSIYLSTSIWVLQLGENSENNILSYILNQELNFILSLILITVAMQILAKYMKSMKKEQGKLLEVNKQLQWSNDKVKETMNYIMEIYQAVDVLTAEKDKSGLINLIVDYTKKITKAKTVIFYSLPQLETSFIIEGEETRQEIEDQIKFKIAETWNIIVASKIPIEVDIKDKKIIFTSIKSNSIPYGILGIETLQNQDSRSYREYMEQLNFLSNLSAIVLERLELEQVNERLIINEEQNRIANEIHDSVLQRLFSASCGLFAIIKSKKNTGKEIEQELSMVRGAINNAMKDLRAAIYSISWKKEGINNFEMDLKKYIHEIESLNDMEINLDIRGDHEILSCQQKKILYRIICEGVGNGVRHGQAQRIEINLNIYMDRVALHIVDNGRGFDYQRLRTQKQGGLGLKNIQHLVHSLKGKIDFNSVVGKGTAIKVTLPIHKQELLKEEVV